MSGACNDKYLTNVCSIRNVVLWLYLIHTAKACAGNVRLRYEYTKHCLFSTTALNDNDTESECPVRLVNWIADNWYMLKCLQYIFFHVYQHNYFNELKLLV